MLENSFIPWRSDYGWTLEKCKNKLYLTEAIKNFSRIHALMMLARKKDMWSRRNSLIKINQHILNQHSPRMKYDNLFWIKKRVIWVHFWDKICMRTCKEINVGEMLGQWFVIILTCLCHSLSHYFQPSIASFHLLATIFTLILHDVPLYV